MISAKSRTRRKAGRRLLPYIVMAAMRGPDHEDAGALEWKEFVTAPLRSLVIRAVKARSGWCTGTTERPESVRVMDGTRVSYLERARKFAQSESAQHVRKHANWGYRALIAWVAGSSKQNARTHQAWLRQQGLL